MSLRVRAVRFSPVHCSLTSLCASPHPNPPPAVPPEEKECSAEMLGKYCRYCTSLVLVHPSSFCLLIEPYLVSRAHGRYSAIRLCARHVTSVDRSRRETAKNARVCSLRPSRSRATGGQKTPTTWFERAIYGQFVLHEAHPRGKGVTKRLRARPSD